MKLERNALVRPHARKGVFPLAFHPQGRRPTDMGHAVIAVSFALSGGRWKSGNRINGKPRADICFFVLSGTNKRTLAKYCTQIDASWR